MIANTFLNSATLPSFVLAPSGKISTLLPLFKCPTISSTLFLIFLFMSTKITFPWFTRSFIKPFLKYQSIAKNKVLFNIFRGSRVPNTTGSTKL